MIMIEVFGKNPLERQVIHNGERYMVNYTPPVLVSYSGEDEYRTMESILISPFTSKEKRECIISRIDREIIVAASEEFEGSIMYLDKDLLEVAISYLQRMNLESFSKNVYENYISILESTVSIEDLE